MQIPEENVDVVDHPALQVIVLHLSFTQNLISDLEEAEFLEHNYEHINQISWGF